jgi:4-hydroxy-3-methylbut-2-enyl diphosphate reductase
MIALVFRLCYRQAKGELRMDGVAGPHGDDAAQRGVLLASPRAFCAGVERAIATVERLLQQRGAPIYVRKQIVHNAHVVEELRRKGAVFVEELEDVPDGASVVFSAHGVSPAVRSEARQRGLAIVDATCPLVAKVHAETRRHTRSGHTVILIGHRGHEEAVGTLGEAPAQVVIVEEPEEVERLQIEGPVTYLMQTTLCADEAADVVKAIRIRFPDVIEPAAESICYATTNRQRAVKAVASDVDVMLVVGSTNSANSLNLVQTAEKQGVEAHLIDDASEIRPEWIGNFTRVGLTAGASASPRLVSEVVVALRAFGFAQVTERSVTSESILFDLPREVRQPRKIEDVCS